MSKTDNTAVQRGQRYANRQEDRGLVRVHPWVPANRKADLLKYAEELRREEAEKGPTPGT